MPYFCARFVCIVGLIAMLLSSMTSARPSRMHDRRRPKQKDMVYCNKDSECLPTECCGKTFGYRMCMAQPKVGDPCTPMEEFTETFTACKCPRNSGCVYYTNRDGTCVAEP